MSDEEHSLPEATPAAEEQPYDAAPVPPPAPSDYAAQPPVPPRRRRGGAVGWGIVLIFVGAALLVGQFAPGMDLWRFWPLIVVALGIRRMFGHIGHRWSIRNVAEGLTTIAIGLVFLGQMLGFLAWNVWLNTLQLWPLLLVALGIEIVGKALRNEWVRAIGSLVIIAGLAYGALVMSPTNAGPFWFSTGGESQSFSRSAPHESGVSEGNALIEGAVGELSVRGGSELVTSEGATPFTPVFESSTPGGKAEVRVGLGSGSWWPGRGQTRLAVTLDEQVTWDLKVNAGVSSYDVDLRDITLSRLGFSAGVSEGTLTLGAPDSKAVPAKIDAGVSSITLRVPRGFPVRATVDAGLTSINVAGDWSESREGNKRIYESSGFSTSEPYWDVVISAGIGSVKVEYY